MKNVPIAEILEPNGKEDNDGREKAVRRDFFETLRKAARQIPFSEDIVAAYFCAFDNETPARTRAILLGALAYFVIPFDAIPDVLALVGFSDDLAVLTAAIAAVRSSITPAHRAAARRVLDNQTTGPA